MERLTKRGNGHAYYPRCFKEPCYGSGCKIKDCPFETEVCECLAAYEDTGLTPGQVANAKTIIESAFAEDTSKAERIRTLLAAEKDGRVVVLPCKVGDTVYFALSGRIIEKQVFSIVSFSNSTRIYCGGTSEYFRPEDIGKTFFLAREEAEKAMKGDTEK